MDVSFTSGRGAMGQCPDSSAYVNGTEWGQVTGQGPRAGLPLRIAVCYDSSRRCAMAKEVTLILADDTYAALATWAGGPDQVSAYLQRLVEAMLANPAQEEQPARRVRAPGMS